MNSEHRLQSSESAPFRLYAERVPSWMSLTDLAQLFPKYTNMIEFKRLRSLERNGIRCDKSDNYSACTVVVEFWDWTFFAFFEGAKVKVGDGFIKLQSFRNTRWYSSPEISESPFRVYIKGIPWKMSNETLTEEMRKQCSCQCAYSILDPKDRPVGYGYAIMSSLEEAERILALGHMNIGSKTIGIERPKKKEIQDQFMVGSQKKVYCHSSESKIQEFTKTENALQRLEKLPAGNFKNLKESLEIPARPSTTGYLQTSEEVHQSAWKKTRSRMGIDIGTAIHPHSEVYSKEDVQGYGRAITRKQESPTNATTPHLKPSDLFSLIHLNKKELLHGFQNGSGVILSRRLINISKKIKGFQVVDRWYNEDDVRINVSDYTPRSNFII